MKEFIDKYQGLVFRLFPSQIINGPAAGPKYLERMMTYRESQDVSCECVLLLNAFDLGGGDWLIETTDAPEEGEEDVVGKLYRYWRLSEIVLDRWEQE